MHQQHRQQYIDRTTLTTTYSNIHRQNNNIQQHTATYVDKTIYSNNNIQRAAFSPLQLGATTDVIAWRRQTVFLSFIFNLQSPPPTSFRGCAPATTRSLAHRLTGMSFSVSVRDSKCKYCCRLNERLIFLVRALEECVGGTLGRNFKVTHKRKEGSRRRRGRYFSWNFSVEFRSSDFPMSAEKL